MSAAAAVAAAANVNVTRGKVLSLYRSLLTAAKMVDNYNFRSHAIRKVICYLIWFWFDLYTVFGSIYLNLNMLE